ncbi:hypothetical protein Trydic_g8945 [Trypoxylus dichotomus]
MSWMKRRGHATSSSNISATQAYSGSQHSNQEGTQWHQPDLASNNWYNQTAQNQPKQQPYQYNPTQTQTNYWQQQYATNNFPQNQPNQYQQQQLYGQHNPQQNYYSGAPQQTLNDQYNQQIQHYNYNTKTEVQNNPYEIQQSQQQTSTTEQDSWGNSWQWGDEDNSNVEPKPPNINSAGTQADAVADSFTAEGSWSWSIDESSSSTSTLNYIKPEHSNATTSLTSLDSFKQEPGIDGLFPKMGRLADKHNNILDNNDAQVNKNLEPAKAPGVIKLRNIESLTPQWSTESQMSQESSDDILQTSESDKMLSRSSTISQSPISGHDGIAENLMPVQEIPNLKYEQQDVKQEPLESSESTQKAYSPPQQYENVEILSNIKQEAVQSYLPPPMGQNAPTTSFKSHTPSPSIQNLTPPPPTQGANKTHTPPPPMKNQTPPMMSSHGSLDDLKNPYKRNTALSHAAASKSRILNPPVGDRLPPPGLQPFTQSVNLETLPDNSEQPDSLLPQIPATNQALKKNNTSGVNTGVQIPTTQQLPDNNEVAPINERNQYLETGQLSDESTNQLQVENNDTLPPPGLRRMVLGQMETNDSNLNAPVDEPPPGLSRMVLGQTESSSSLTNALNPRDSNGPPVGFSRMVPGESSSPESNPRHQYQVYQDDNRHEEYNSEVEMNQLHSNNLPQTRSATIGADTPPTVPNPAISQSNMNRSETIGSDSKPEDVVRPVGVVSENRVGAMGVDRDEMGSNNQDNIHTGENRRDSIEGEPQDKDLKDLIGGVRDMTVSTDVGASNNELEQSSRGRSRQESTDSDREGNGNKSPRDHRERDRRYREKDDRREKNRSRYSPDNYRDRRYDRRRPRDRRYDDESDYYSDKEKENRREERKEDYDKRYGSMRSKDKDRRRRDVRDTRDRRDPRDDRDVRDSRDPRDGREYDRRDYHREYDRRDVRNRGDYHYYDDGYDGQRSRPSSRSDSMHESYRDRHERDHRRQRPRERERDPRRHRDFNPYMPNFNYDPYSPYYQQYQYYYENLRRTNPQAYLEWYRKYYEQAGIASSAANFNEDRGSVHSGRSSANDEMKERYMRQNYYSHSSLPHVGGYYRDTHSVSGQYGMDETSYGRPFDATESVILDDSTAQAQRLTPTKFATAHLKVSISSGKLVKILPNYPLDGQSAIVELMNVQNLLTCDDEIEELSRFPGPLVRGTTHKKTVIEYCESKIKYASWSDSINDPNSYILLWQLMILLIRQNGMVVGTDIAELLMKNHNQENVRPVSASSNASSEVVEGVSPSDGSNLQSTEVLNAPSVPKEEVTDKFREYLIYGSGKEALEWAMKHGLWGHALFLASKLDKRTYANVMMRFANGLTMNDPLQTLYQLLSGRIPAAVTAVADKKWGDWRPHLAMILSNTTSKPELDRKAITTLADTLMARGSIYAAQFCYLMAEIGFNRYGSDNAKLVLLGSNHHKPFLQFATNEAIHLTEIYEYACSLNDAGFLIIEFQPYKYLLASRLSDYGMSEKALAYLEKVSQIIIQNPSTFEPTLVDRVCHLADKLKYYDPVEETDENAPLEGDLEVSRPDNSWLKDLKTIQNDYQMGLISHEGDNNLVEAPQDYETLQARYEYQTQMQETWQKQQQFQQHDQQQVDQYQQRGGYAQWQGGQEIQGEVLEEQQLQLTEQQEGYHPGQYQDQQTPYWPQQQLQQQQWGGDLQPGISYGGVGQVPQENQLEQETNHQQQANDYWNNAQNEPEGCADNSPKEVSKNLSTLLSSNLSLQNNPPSSLRKRLTVSSPKLSPLHRQKSTDSANAAPSQKDDVNKSDFDLKKLGNLSKKSRIYPYKQWYSKNNSFEKRSSSRESSDNEFDSLMKNNKNIEFKNEEKSQLISCKDNNKIISIKSNTKLTKYNTFDMKFNEKRGKMVKYKSLDDAEPKTTVVKYLDTQSNISISAQEFDSDFRRIKFEKRKPKHDIICDTVDSWAKKSTNKNVFSNIRSSIFKSNSQEKEVVYKPLVFGGTYPIDAPLKIPTIITDEPIKFDEKPKTPSSVDKSDLNFKSNHLYKVPRVRQYGPAKSFDIDVPI